MYSKTLFALFAASSAMAAGVTNGTQANETQAAVPTTTKVVTIPCSEEQCEEKTTVITEPCSSAPSPAPTQAPANTTSNGTAAPIQPTTSGPEQVNGAAAAGSFLGAAVVGAAAFFL